MPEPDREGLLAMYSAALSPDPYEGQEPVVPQESDLDAEFRRNAIITDGSEDEWEPESPGLTAENALRLLYRRLGLPYGYERPRQEADNETRRHFLEFVPDPAAPEDVAALEVLTLEDETYRCCICLDPQVAGDKHLGFHCGHVMHESCSRTWFEYGKTCPLCRGTPWHKEDEPDRTEA